MVQNGDIVAMEDYWEMTWVLSNGTNINDLE